jgi:PAS domain-containing protein
MIAYLEQLPALTLLERLPVPMLAVGKDGIILYTNPACAEMLGQPHDGLIGHPLDEFLDVGVGSTPGGSFQMLHAAAGALTAWRHCEHGAVKAISSPPLLMRHDDPVLLVALTDVTEWLWTVESG